MDATSVYPVIILSRLLNLVWMSHDKSMSAFHTKSGQGLLLVKVI